MYYSISLHPTVQQYFKGKMENIFLPLDPHLSCAGHSSVPPLRLKFCITSGMPVHLLLSMSATFIISRKKDGHLCSCSKKRQNTYSIRGYISPLTDV